MSLANRLKEDARRIAVPGDTRFTSATAPYVFVLRVPSSLSTSEDFALPLPMPPSEYRLTTPFAAEVSATEGAGTWADESGVTQRELYLSGTTGWAPKAWTGTTGALLRSPTTRWARQAGSPLAPINQSISGQKWFDLLEDAIFMRYAELKADPEYAHDTRLEFHNFKLGHHFEVVPTQFGEKRSARSQTLTRQYEIRAAVVRTVGAEKSLLQPPEQGWADGLRSAIRTVQRAIDTIRGAIQDIQRFVAQGRKLVQSVANIVSGAIDALGSALDFASGLTDFISLPIVTIERLAQEVSDLLDSADIVGDRFRRSILQLRDGLDLMLLHPEVFEETPSALQITMTSTDSLQSLAAQYLGDSSRWHEIAEINNLRHPYVSEQDLPGTITTGDALLVPRSTQPASELAEPVVLGAQAKDSVAARTLGTDISVLYEPAERLHDWALSPAGDDVARAEGVEAVSQALIKRTRYALGEWITPSVGLQRPTGIGTIDRELWPTRISEAMLSDPRVQAVTRVSIDPTTSPDVVSAEVDVETIDARGPLRLRV